MLRWVWQSRIGGLYSYCRRYYREWGLSRCRTEITTERFFQYCVSWSVSLCFHLVASLPMLDCLHRVGKNQSTCFDHWYLEIFRHVLVFTPRILWKVGLISHAIVVLFVQILFWIQAHGVHWRMCLIFGFHNRVVNWTVGAYSPVLLWHYVVVLGCGTWVSRIDRGVIDPGTLSSRFESMIETWVLFSQLLSLPAC